MLTVEDLFNREITISDNTATNMMMNLLGFDDINECIQVDLRIRFYKEECLILKH